MNIATLIAACAQEIPISHRELFASYMERAYTLGRIHEVEDSLTVSRFMREAEDYVCTDCHGKGGKTADGVEYCNCEVPALVGVRQAG